VPWWLTLLLARYPARKTKGIPLCGLGGSNAEAIEENPLKQPDEKFFNIAGYSREWTAPCYSKAHLSGGLA